MQMRQKKYRIFKNGKLFKNTAPWKWSALSTVIIIRFLVAQKGDPSKDLFGFLLFSHHSSSLILMNGYC
jgi:hypothetical protein